MADKADVIDSLLVSLGLDTDSKSFQAGNDAVRGIKDGVLQLAAAAGVGISFKGIVGVAQTAVEMDRLAKNTRFTIEQIDGLQHAMRRLNLPPEAAFDIVKSVPQMAQAAREGNLGTAAYYSNLFRPEEFARREKESPIESLKYLAESYSNLNISQKRKLREGLGIGEDDPFTRLLETGKKGIEDAIKSYQAIAQPIDQSLIDNANKFNEEMAELNLHFDNLQRQIGGPLLDSVNEFLSRVNEFAKENQNEIKSVIESAVSGSWYENLMDDAEKRGIEFRNYLRQNDAIMRSILGPVEVFKERNVSDNGRSIGSMPSAQPIQHAQSVNSGNSNLPLGIRNLNPGNLRYAGQAGATQGEGGFARFESQEAGLSALHRQLGLYFKRGKNTISDIVNTYAPAEDKNDVPAYIRAISNATGKGANEPLSFNDTDTIKKMMYGMVSHEVGSGYVAMSDIEGVVDRASMNRVGLPDNFRAMNNTPPTMESNSGSAGQVSLTQHNEFNITTTSGDESSTRRIVREELADNLNQTKSLLLSAGH